MWPESTGVPRSLKRSRNHGLTLPRPELVTEPTGMNLAPGAVDGGHALEQRLGAADS